MYKCKIARQLNDTPRFPATISTAMNESLAFTYGHWDTDGFIEGERLGSVEVDGLPLG